MSARWKRRSRRGPWERTWRLSALEAAASAARFGGAVVVTESVFSVNGDLAPLRELHAIARRHGALLLVDDAHGVGLLGPSGAGGVAAAGLAGEPDVIVTATLSKSLGGAGGVVAGPHELIAALVDTGRTFIYDTGMPPAVAAGCLAALGVVAYGRRSPCRGTRSRCAARREAPRGRTDGVGARGRRTVGRRTVAVGRARLGGCLPGPWRRGRLLPATVHTGRYVAAAPDHQCRDRASRLRARDRRDSGDRTVRECS